ncbi:MAG TPA: hypothetical protein VIL95_02035 [Bacillota bacterium]
MSSERTHLRAERLEVPADWDAVQELFLERQWTDGLPIVPPTEQRVQAMLATVPGEPTTSLGQMPPLYAEATLEKLAINAVMAGCRPDYFPVIVAAVRAMLRAPFNLYGIQATTHPVAPLLVVHGPIARRLRVHGGSGAFGPGFHANATIGRAIRLILMNIGGAWPGGRDRATHGSPAKFSYCMTENTEASPWPEFHTSRGFGPDDSAVTVFGGEAPHNVNDHESSDPVRFLDIVADAMAQLGHNNWYIAQDGFNNFAVVLSPEHAALIAGAGWTRYDVQRYLFVQASRPVSVLRRGGMWDMRDWPAWMEAMARDPEARIPVVRRPDDILVFVAGGPGKHSLVIPSFGATQSVTEPV